MANDDAHDGNGLDLTTRMGSVSAHGANAFITLIAILTVGAIVFVLHLDHLTMQRQMEEVVREHHIQSWLLSLSEEERERLHIPRPKLPEAYHFEKPLAPKGVTK